MTDHPPRQMHFALMLGGYGGCLGAWRMPGAVYGPEDFPLALHCARLAERAKLDMLFVADAPASTTDRPHQFEALTQVAALVSATEHIGLAATASTTYSEPYNVARMVASIDHMSGGRMGLNVVTTAVAEVPANYGVEQPLPKAERYQRAAEYVDVLKGLWDSWEEGAVVADKATGRLIDNTKRHALEHKGRYYSVKGPLNMTRSPQGQPVIVQAGSSEFGLPFAAQVGEAIFTVEADAETSKAFCQDIRERAAGIGRDGSLIRILPGFVPFIAETEAKARQMFAEIASFIDPVAAWAKLTARLGVDLSGYDPEGPMPVIPKSEMRRFGMILTRRAEQRGYNLRQVRDLAAVTIHPPLIGTPEMVADELERWFRMGACDGFMILPPFTPGPVEIFMEQVIPILQKRGLFRTDYTGTTLRHHLGLPTPAHPRSKAANAA